MKKILFFVPAVFALLLYIALGFSVSFRTIDPLIWLWIVILFVSAAVMFKRRWYGCIGGLLVGCVLIYMSAQDTGQVIAIERPLGMILCVYYLICGVIVYQKAK